MDFLKIFQYILATVVEGDLKASFPLATTPKEGATLFRRLLHFTLDTYLYNVKKGDLKYHFFFLVFGMT